MAARSPKTRGPAKRPPAEGKAKPRKAAAAGKKTTRAPAKSAGKPAARRKPTTPPAATPTAATQEEPASVASGWVPVDAPTGHAHGYAQGARPPPRAFDPVTGAWLPAPQDGPAAAAAPVPPLDRAAADPSRGPVDPSAPDAPKKGTTSYVLWSVLLWIDLGLIALNTLTVIFVGIVLLAAPDSELADTFRDQLEISSPAALLVGTLSSFAMFGVIPFAWVLGTRRVPVEGTRRFLRLHEPARGILRGILLTIPLLVAVAILSSVYTVATQGVDALTDPPEGTNPAVEAILANLTWPLVVIVALGSGIGEEIFFRGFLQRYVGTWGQASLFGLAHLAGGYPPQVVFAFGLGVLFGYLLKRGWSLWTMITAHVLYNFVLLALGLASR